MKNNKINVIVALCLICVLSLALATQTVAMATIDEKQTKSHNVSTVGRYELFSAAEGDGSYNVSNYVARYVNSVVAPKFSTPSGTEAKLSTSAPTAVQNYNANFFVYADFADNIAAAIKNGAISVTTEMWLKSENGGWTDPTEKSYGEFSFGTRGEASYEAISQTREAKDNGFTSALTVASSVNQGTATTNYLQYKAEIAASQLVGKDVSSVMFHGYSKLGGVGGKNVLYIKSPVLTLTTTDTVAPSLANVVVRNNADGTRTVVFTVTDELSGVQNVACSGNVVSGGKKEMSADTRTAVYEYVVGDADAVTLQMTDNVGNVATTEVKIGKVSLDKLFVDKNIAFSASLPDGSYRFTTNGTTPDETSAVATNGTNQATVSGKGSYTLRVVGNATGATYTTEYVAEFRVDDTDYIVDVAANNCIVNGEQTSKYGGTVTLNIVPNDGCELYKVLIDGAEVKPTATLTLTVTADVSVQVICRLVIDELVPVQTEFVYDGNEIVLDFGNVDVSDILFDFGNGATFAKAAGIYNVSWSVDNDRAVGSGNFELYVESKVVTVTDVVTDYVYKQFDFAYVLSEQIDCVSVSFRNVLNLECTPKLPGKYTYKIVSTDSSVIVEGDAEGEIVIQKIKITVDVITEIFKQFDEVSRQLEVRLKDEIDELVDKINVSLYLNDAAVDEVYNAGEYRYEINLVDGADDLYEVVGSEGSFVVQPKTLHLRPLKNQYRYVGQAKTDILYEVVESLPDGITLGGALAYDGDGTGAYPVTPGNVYLQSDNEEDKNNYTLALCDEEVIYTVLAQKIVVKTISAEAVYGDEELPVAANLLYGQLADGERLVAVRKQGTDVGSYAIDQVKVVDELGTDVSANYSIVVIAGTYNIAKRVVEITADGFSKVYGDNDGEITFTADGLVDGDVLEGSLAREQGEDVGLYKVLVGTLSNANYDIVVKQAYCTITAKKVVVTAEDVSKIYGENDPQIVAECDGVDVQSLGLRFAREAGEDVGKYAVTLAEIANNNYEAEFVGATLTITPAEVIVELFDADKTYGEADPDFEFVVDGADVDELQLELTRQLGEDVGCYEIYVTCSKNYNISANKATLTIVRADVKLSAEEQTTVYDGNAKSYQTDDGLTVVYRDENGNTVEAPTDAGEYEVEVIYAGDDNHNAATVKTKFVVKRKLITVVVDATPVVYDGQPVNPVFTLSQDVNAMVVFDDGVVPTAKGKYGYTIMFESKNYYCNVHLTLVVE